MSDRKDFARNPKNIKFKPFAEFLRNCGDVEQFVQLTRLYYGLATQLILVTDQSDVAQTNLPPPQLPDTYSMGDDAPDPEVIAGWLSVEEYAGHTGEPVSKVAADAAAGLLGEPRRHKATGVECFLWPPELRSKDPDTWPEPGEYEVSVAQLRVIRAELDPADVSRFRENQLSLLALAHSLGDPLKLGEKAEAMLLQSAFLNLWTAFEVFLRSTIRELIIAHPEKLSSTPSGKRLALTYDEIVQATGSFTSIDSLREEIVRREIDRSEAGDMSASGMINYLKAEFAFADDPYDAWYMLDGARKETHYEDIVEVREVRNALMHGNGRASPRLLGQLRYACVQDGAVIIDLSYFTRTRLLLQAVAFKLAHSIDSGAYSPQKS